MTITIGSVITEQEKPKNVYKLMMSTIILPNACRCRMAKPDEKFTRTVQINYVPEENIEEVEDFFGTIAALYSADQIMNADFNFAVTYFDSEGIEHEVQCVVEDVEGVGTYEEIDNNCFNTADN